MLCHHEVGFFNNTANLQFIEWQMFKYIFTGYSTSAQRLTLHSGFDLNDLYEGESLVGQCCRCE